MKKSRNRIVLFNIASTIILQGLAFISGPIFSGSLGPHNYGIVSVYATWVQIASTVYSLQASGTIANARVSYPEDQQEKFQSSIFGLSTLSYLIFSGITLLAVLVLRRWFGVGLAMTGCVLAQGWGFYMVNGMNAKFTYEFKADKNFILSVTTSALTIGLSIVLIRSMPKDVNYWGRILGQAGVYVVIGLILFIYMMSRGRTFYDKGYWMFALPIAVPTIFHSLALIVLNQSDRVMLQSMVENSAAGIYSLAFTFGGVLSTIYRALNNSWVPFYYDYTKKGEIEEMKVHAKNYMELFTILSMGVILLAREVFHIYANVKFWSGTDLIPLFSIGNYFIFLYSFPVNYEFYHKNTKIIAIGTTGAAVFNIVLNYFLIGIWGIYGAVIATAAAHGLQFIFHFACVGRIKGDVFPFRLRDFMPGFVAVCLTCVFYWLTRDYWLVRWGVGGILGIYLLTKMYKRREIF